MYVDKDFIKKDSIERREYQVKIARSASDENTLVVLPTGLGKTVIALFLIADEIKKKGNKVLFLAPTKPLVSQHASFLRNFLSVDNEIISVFTGDIRPDDREELWKEKRIIVSTPQVIENDLLAKRLSLKDVSFLVFDEAHHAVGDYSYVFISKMYHRQADNRLVLGMTASPGNDVDKILEVCKNLDIQNIEIRTKHDSDVKPYVHKLDMDWKEVKLPEGFSYTVQLLRKALSKQLKVLKNIGVLDTSSVSRINKTKLLDAQKKIQYEIKSRNKPSRRLFKAAQIQSEAMKIHYGLELFQTQGVSAFKNYFQRMSKEASSKKSSKSSKNLMSDSQVIKAFSHAKSLDVEHPKVDVTKNIVKGQLKKKSGSRIIVFTHYRDTSAYVTKVLEDAEDVKPVRFIGQASKGKDKGLTQKQQAEVIEKFKKGVYNVLVATSVAEEGLDIPSTDLVVFYEPIPSEIRLIQRRGRTGRKMPGRVMILITKGTSDEGYYWSAKSKEKRMRSELELLRSKISKKFEDAESLYKEQKKEKKRQKSLKYFEGNNEEIKVVVDNREHKSNVVKSLVAGRNITVEPRQLDVGDYVVSSRIGIERKRVDDFLSSLLEGKLFRQISELQNAFSRPILIIEGEDLFSSRNINHSSIYGTLASITVDFGISVFRSVDDSETADLIYAIAKREQKEKSKDVVIRGNKGPMSLREKQQFIVEGLPSVSSVLAKRLLNHFGSIRDIVNTSEEELREVRGVGKNIANDILEILHARYLEK